MQLTGIQKHENRYVMRIRIIISFFMATWVFFVPFHLHLLYLLFASFVLQSFLVEGVYHRYFSHKSYRTSRWFQAVLAYLAPLTTQRGVIWWAMHHRRHHRYSDTPKDPHSPVQFGRFYAWFGWTTATENVDTNLDAVRDLQKFPELVFINQWHWVVPLLYLLFMISLGYFKILGGGITGLQTAVYGYFVPTFLSLNGAALVNAFAHGSKPGLFASRPFNTRDTTTNVWPLTILSWGANWHNNHHYNMNSAKAGIHWWQLDPTYLMLRVLSFTGLIWDLKMPVAMVETAPLDGEGSPEACSK